MTNQGTSWPLRAGALKFVFMTALISTAAETQPASPAPASPTVRHPNLLLNRQEIDQIKVKVRDHKWAADLLAQVKALADGGGRIEREAAICYVVTGERRYADVARRILLDDARGFEAAVKTVDLKLQPEWGAWTPWGVYAWAYDLTFDTFSPEERQRVEQWLRAGCRLVIQGEKLWTTTPNLAHV